MKTEYEKGKNREGKCERIERKKTQFEAETRKKVKIMNLQQEKGRRKLQNEAWRRNNNGGKRLHRI
jgi:hypothetical protein